MGCFTAWTRKEEMQRVRETPLQSMVEPDKGVYKHKSDRNIVLTHLSGVRSTVFVNGYCNASQNYVVSNISLVDELFIYLIACRSKRQPLVKFNDEILSIYTQKAYSITSWPTQEVTWE